MLNSPAPASVAPNFESQTFKQESCRQTNKLIMDLQRHPRFHRLLDPASLSCGILGLAFVTALVGPPDPSSTSSQTIVPGLAGRVVAQPPLPPPMLYRKMSREKAAAYNAAVPFTVESNVPAKPFRLDVRSADYARSLECLTAAAFYEASGEGPVGEAAVAQVVLNRVRHPAFPASVCAVVYQGSTRPTGCQFTFTCDGSLLRQRNARGWMAAETIAATALTGTVLAGAGLATHYHANSVVPYWAGSLAKNAQVGAHIFYRWPGTWGRPNAFRQRYAGEPWQETQLRNASLVAHRNAPDADAGPPIAVVVNGVAKPDPLSVVDLLASGDPAHGDAKLAKASFKDEAEAEAVHAYRDFATAHPKVNLATVSTLLSGHYGEAKALGVDQLSEAMKDFAASPVYAGFVKRAQLSSAERKRFSSALLSSLRDVQAYAGVQMGTVSVTLQPALGSAVPALSQCPTERRAGPSKRIHRTGRRFSKPQVQDPLGAQLGQAAADYLRWAARAQGNGTNPVSACSSAVDQQVVAAVLSRMIALRKGEAAAQRQIAWEVRHGHGLVPLLVQRLRVFEKSRDRFVTLSGAYVALVARLPALSAQQPRIPVVQESLSSGEPTDAAAAAETHVKTGH